MARHAWMICLSKVRSQHCQRRVSVEVDGVATATEMDHRRARDCDLRRRLPLAARFLDLLLEEFKVIDLDRFAVSQLARDDQRRWCKALLRCIRAHQLATDFNAVEMLKEIQMEKRTAEFPICDRSQACLKLLPYYFGNVLVLELMEFCDRAVPCRDLFAKLQDILRPQQ